MTHKRSIQDVGRELLYDPQESRVAEWIEAMESFWPKLAVHEAKTSFGCMTVHTPYPTHFDHIGAVISTREGAAEPLRAAGYEVGFSLSSVVAEELGCPTLIITGRRLGSIIKSSSGCSAQRQVLEFFVPIELQHLWRARNFGRLGQCGVHLGWRVETQEDFESGCRQLEGAGYFPRGTGIIEKESRRIAFYDSSHGRCEIIVCLTGKEA